MGASLLAFGRMIMVLGLIVGGLLLLAKFAQKRQGRGGGLRLGAPKQPSTRIEVLSRRSLGRHVSLLVVRVADRTILVGQSAQQMTLLAELEGEQWVESGAPAGPQGFSSDLLLQAPRTVQGSGVTTPGAWDAVMDRLREMTVRH
jgi:flagellar biogenesis protein FliO